MSPLIAVMFLASSAPAISATLSSHPVSSQPVPQGTDLLTSQTNGSSEGTSAIPETNTVVNVYEETGYNGNSTIYPTVDTIPYTLPTESAFHSQTVANSSVYQADVLRVATSTEPGEGASYGYSSIAGYDTFVTQIWYVATGGGQQYCFPVPPLDLGCSNTVGLNVQVTPSGLPSDNSNDFEIGPTSGINVTAGNLTGLSGTGGAAELSLLLAAGMAVASVIFPELVGIEVLEVGASLISLIGPAGPSTSIVGSSLPSTAGDAMANELDLVDNGTYYVPGGPNETGQNVFSQADQVEEQFSAVSQVTPGSLTIHAANIIDYALGGSGTSYRVGANASISYPVVPAVSVAGYVHLWKGGPPVPAANVVIQQQYTDSTFQSNYEHPSASNGYYHVFLKPLSVGNGMYTQMNAYLSDPMGDTDTNVGELEPTTDWTHEGGNVSDVDANLSGGQLNGTVKGELDTGGTENLGGATVELCNVQGCISTTTNEAGAYTLQFPVAGTSSDEDSLTVSDGSSWATTELTGLELPVDQYSQENIALEASAGGGCVAEGTPILTPSGYVPVQNLEAGQTIEEFDFATHSIVPSEFLSANVTSVDSLVDVNDGLLYLTPTDQPIYIENHTFTGWLRDPQNLTTLDEIFDPVRGAWVAVTSTSKVSRETEVYDVLTGGFNNFVANGILLDKKA